MADGIANFRQSDPHLGGNLAPVRTEADFDLTIRGKIPVSLRGALYRNGPNPQFDPGPDYHSFLGDGMIHGFWIGAGRARYRNRYVRTPRWLAEHAAGRAFVPRAANSAEGDGWLLAVVHRAA
ncbi:MAG: carotenoid oxygenase family protein [Steroidobacteraceae bacterium]